MSDQERVKVGGLRTLGGVGGEGAKPEPVRGELAEKARALLGDEFDKALILKEKMRAEGVIGAKEKDRDSQRPDERFRGLVASLEGMSKFALKMGLITAAEARRFYEDAMEKGFYEGW
ncbi:MAG TPA: hypothetical protein VGB83_04975 [Actinomycetota bacterium]